MKEAVITITLGEHKKMFYFSAEAFRDPIREPMDVLNLLYNAGTVFNDEDDLFELSIAPNQVTMKAPL